MSFVSDTTSVTSDLSEASSRGSAFSHMMPFKMAPLNVSLSVNQTAAYPQYPKAVFPNLTQFLATGVYVNDDAEVFLHVLADGKMFFIIGLQISILSTLYSSQLFSF